MNEKGNSESLPAGKSRPPVAIGHFPDALHAAVWRNWDLVPMHRLAEVFGSTPKQLEEIAHSMGLEKQKQLRPDVIQRSYVTLIRRNWHLLPYEQLCKLLGWDAPMMLHALQEDDFLWVKLGMQKPKCEPIVYGPPGAEARRQAAWIEKTIREELGSALRRDIEPPLTFIDRYAVARELVAPQIMRSSDRFELRMVYPYFLRYGDPLVGSAIDDVPEAFLAELAGVGVNAIWLQCVLRELAPWKLDPSQSAGWEERMQNLGRLVDRCGKSGIGVYLYLNEPRCLPDSFFQRHPQLRGIPESVDRPGQFPNSFTLCTSVPEVQEFLTASVEHVFRSVPRLAGAFTITFSENLTNCYSRDYDDARACPRCRARGPEAVIAEVNELVVRGMKNAGVTANLLVYDWAWPEKWVAGIIERLPRESWLMRVSEWGQPFQRGDFSGEVGEYSISVVGPSDKSKLHWELARKRGLKTVAKVQISNSWELANVHYIPAMRLVAEHLANLCRADVDGLMLGWTLGGLPCLNFHIVAEFLDRSRDVTPQSAMAAVAEKVFGKDIAPQIVRAWDRFSDAFAEFPFDLKVVYFAPLQMGPANLLYPQPTGYDATMCGIPYDDLAGWRGPYGAGTLYDQFAKVAEGFREGISLLAAALRKAPSHELSEHVRTSEAAAIHFQSVANQIRFIQNRGSNSELIKTLLRSEIDLARRMCDLVAEDSRIGFEATNHYFYTRAELIEKILNCRHLLENLGQL